MGGPLSLFSCCAVRCLELQGGYHLRSRTSISPLCVVAEKRTACKNVRNSNVSFGGSEWYVERDIRDLGGHLDTAHRGDLINVTTHSLKSCRVQASVNPHTPASQHQRF